MTSIIVDDSAGPKLHAFVIGVGAYSHLENGSSPQRLPYAMGQLDAAPKSALAITNWLLNKYDGPTPLGSIEVLVSDIAVPSVVNNGQPISINDRANNASSIKAGFRRWFSRLNGEKLVDGLVVKPSPEIAKSMEENISLFFFCGHGFEKGDVYLLLESFGEDPNVFFENSVNFNDFYRGMRRAKAKTQLYFVDCCRTAPKAVTDRDELYGIRLIDPLITDKNAREAPILYSTLSNTTAWAPLDGSPTNFTQTLITCLSGAASEHEEGSWRVTTGKLITSMKLLLNSDPIRGQICINDGDRLAEDKVLCLLDKAPKVKLTVDCRPTHHLNKLAFAISSGAYVVEERTVPEAAPWEVEVDAASYTLKTTVSGEINPIPEEPIFVFPPKKQRIFDIR